MVHHRTANPTEKVVVEDHPTSEYRVAWDEMQGRIGIEHATKESKQVAQGIYFDDVESIDRLIEGLDQLRSHLASISEREEP